MNDMERRKFEDSFKDAFDGAEMHPGENLWTNIELDLEKAARDKATKRIFFYQMLAAASVTFALSVMGIGYYMIQKDDFGNSTELASRDSNAPNTAIKSDGSANENSEVSSLSDTNTGFDSGSGTDANSTNSNLNSTLSSNSIVTEQPNRPRLNGLATSEAQNSQEKSGISNIFHPDALDQSGSGGEKTSTVASNTMVIGDDGLTSTTNVTSGVYPSAGGTDKLANSVYDRQLPIFYAVKQPTLKFEESSTTDPGMLLLAKLADEERQYAEKDKDEKNNKSERLWTSVGFAAGGFNSINASASPTPSNSLAALSNSTVPDKQAKASGVAYSYGVNLGARISKRWVVQGGVNYLTQSSDYTATNVVTVNDFRTLKAESVNDLFFSQPQSAARADNKLATTTPYSVNNNVQFFSVPVQAGYLLVNKKFGVMLNGGVSTDLFLRNTITPESGSLDKTTTGRGEASPYRSVNFSGLMGTELSYRFGQHYRVALNPGVRYPLNNVYKSDIGIESAPLTFDVGLRFRYIFH